MRRNIRTDNCHIIAVDNSQAMVERCKVHLQGFKSEVPVTVTLGDINELEIAKCFSGGNELYAAVYSACTAPSSP